MNIIQQLITDVVRHQRSLEERLAVLKDEQSKTKKILSQVARHRERLERDHGNGEAALPLVPPDNDEEEATDEPVDVAKTQKDATDEPLVPGEWNPGFEVPEEPADPLAANWEPAAEPSPEPEKPSRRRKAKTDPTLGGTAPFQPLSKAVASEEVAGG